MDSFTPVSSLIGGVLIGVSVTLMLALHGRITGITGIMVGATFSRSSGDWLWRVLFLLGLVVGGVLMLPWTPEALAEGSPRGFLVVALAGLLVGFGTRLGNGCTSGHGVCGVSRLSARSLVATASFMTAGMVTVFVVRAMTGS